MGQLDDGLGGVVLTRVVATKLVRINTSVLEQGVKRRLVDEAGGVLSDRWRGSAKEKVDLGNDAEEQQLVVNTAVWDVVKLGDVLEDVGGVVCDEGCVEGGGTNGSAEDAGAGDAKFEWSECR
eukprot:819704-Rhodomonas_salina.1